VGAEQMTAAHRSVDKSLLAVDARRSYSMHEVVPPVCQRTAAPDREMEAARDDFLLWWPELARGGAGAVLAHKATLEPAGEGP